MPVIIQSMPYIWLGAAVVLFILESMTVGLYFIWYGLGSLGALLISLTGAPVWLQVVVFLAISVVTLWLTRPIVMKHLLYKRVSTNFDMVIGKTGVVTSPVDNNQPSGLVHVNGQDWTARSADGSVIETGEQVTVIRVEGVRVLVERIRVSEKNPELGGSSES